MRLCEARLTFSFLVLRGVEMSDVVVSETLLQTVEVSELRVHILDLVVHIRSNGDLTPHLSEGLGWLIIDLEHCTEEYRNIEIEHLVARSDGCHYHKRHEVDFPRRVVPTSGYLQGEVNSLPCFDRKLAAEGLSRSQTVYIFIKLERKALQSKPSLTPALVPVFWSFNSSDMRFCFR